MSENLRDVHAPSTPNDVEFDRVGDRRGDPWWRRLFHTSKAVFSSDPVPSRVAAARVRAQQAITVGRRVAVLGAAGGAGSTTVALLLAQAVQDVRGGGVALLAWPGDDALEALTPTNLMPSVTRKGGAPRPALTLGSIDVTEVENSVVAHSRSHDVTIIDAGRNIEAVLAARPHVVVLVLRNTVLGQHQAGDAHARIAALLDVPVLMVLREMPRSGQTSKRTGITDDGDDFYLPHDAHIAGQGRLEFGHLGESARTAIEELAGAVVDLR